jgi:hypothetical protein
MSIRENRNREYEAIIEGRFITHVLQKNSEEIDDDITKRVAEFGSPLWDKRSFGVNANTLTYIHLKQHRFVDMKSRKSLRGKRNKRSHAVHNKPLYGHANEIIRDLTVGLTQAVKDDMMRMDGTEL